MRFTLFRRRKQPDAVPTAPRLPAYYIVRAESLTVLEKQVTELHEREGHVPVGAVMHFDAVKSQVVQRPEYFAQPMFRRAT